MSVDTIMNYRGLRRQVTRGANHTRLELGMEAQDAAAGRSGSLFTRVDWGMGARGAVTGHLRDLDKRSQVCSWRRDSGVK
jgi:hypothetical protein